MSPPSSSRSPPSASRYELLYRLAAGGMATVFVGRLRGAAGFSRLVAIKRAHSFLIADPAFKKMLIAEARLASRIHHPHVVSVLDVEEIEGELLLVMDYVEGASVAKLLSRALQCGAQSRMPAGVAVKIALDVCAGLHAAHTLTDGNGNPLGIVHRDVSPQNVLVGTDGIARIADFGVAKCAEAPSGVTATGALKGKVGYMAPEYITHRHIDARSDVFALGVVLWESLANQRLFRDDDAVSTLERVLSLQPSPPSMLVPALGTALDAVVARALDKSPAHRFQTALEFGQALEAAARPGGHVASSADVGAYVRAHVGDDLARVRAVARQHAFAEASAARDEIVAPPTEDLPPASLAVAPDGGIHGPAISPFGRFESEDSAQTDTVSSSPTRAIRDLPAGGDVASRSAILAAIGLLLVAMAGIGGFALARLRTRAVAPIAPGAPESVSGEAAAASADPAAATSSLAVSPPVETTGAASAPTPTATAPTRAATVPRSVPPKHKGLPSSSRAIESAATATSDDRAPPNPYRP